MKFTISRDALLKPLNLVAGVVERRQTLPILANVLMNLDGEWLSLTGTSRVTGGRAAVRIPNLLPMTRCCPLVGHQSQCFQSGADGFILAV